LSLCVFVTNRYFIHEVARNNEIQMKGNILIRIVFFVSFCLQGFSQNDIQSEEFRGAKPVFSNGSYFYAVKGKPVMNRFNIKSATPLTISVSGLPQGMVYNKIRNLVEGSVAVSGIYKYKVKAINTDGSDSLTVTLDVRNELQSETPPMGWMTWNIFTSNYNETILKQIADAMVSSGMRDAGFNYLIIDDCWPAQTRDANGLIQPSKTKFPSGMKSLADYVHSKGLKLGIYSDAAPTTCGGYLGSYGYEQNDANQFASWGIDFVKYDYCGAPSNAGEANKRYAAMRHAIENTGRLMTYNVCEWGQLTPWSWSPKIEGNMWRMSFDGRDTWDHGQYNSAHCGVIQVLNLMPGLEYYSGPNAWNDPDMLMTGLYGTGQSSSANGANGMSLTEYQSQFSLWCLFSAPLFTSFDIRKINADTKKILLNTEAIAIDQDGLGQQASRIKKEANYEIYAKDLADGSKAVGMLNLSTQTVSITANWADLYISGNHTIRDVWKKQNVGSSAVSFTASVKSHETILLRITPSAVSVKDESKPPVNFQASIYDNKIYYSYSLFEKEPIKLELIGINGSLISVYEDSNQYFTDVKGEMDCQDLKQGIYLLRLVSRNGTSVQKLVK
jgi:alpha-galactosidase